MTRGMRRSTRSLHAQKRRNPCQPSDINFFVKLGVVFPAAQRHTDGCRTTPTDERSEDTVGGTQPPWWRLEFKEFFGVAVLQHAPAGWTLPGRGFVAPGRRSWLCPPHDTERTYRPDRAGIANSLTPRGRRLWPCACPSLRLAAVLPLTGTSCERRERTHHSLIARGLLSGRVTFAEPPRSCLSVGGVMSPLLSCRDGRAYRGWPRRNPSESGCNPDADTPAQRRLKVRTLWSGSEKTFPPLASSGSSGTFSQTLAQRVRAGRRADIGRRDGRGSRACGVVFAKNRTRRFLASHWRNRENSSGVVFSVLRLRPLKHRPRIVAVRSDKTRRVEM
jgi:hypothetical protein